MKFIFSEAPGLKVLLILHDSTAWPEAAPVRNGC